MFVETFRVSVARRGYAKVIGSKMGRMLKFRVEIMEEKGKKKKKKRGKQTHKKKVT